MDRRSESPYTDYRQSTISIAASILSSDTLSYTCGTGGVDFIKNGSFVGIYFIPDAREHVDPSKWEIIDNLEIHGNSFSNVYKSKYVDGADIYFSKNIGVIKADILNDTTNSLESWSLLRYNIIQ